MSWLQLQTPVCVLNAHPFADSKMELRPFGFYVHVVSFKDVILCDFCTKDFQICG